ncbi:3-oxoacid CoA-transferase [soil metagenome]
MSKIKPLDEAIHTLVTPASAVHVTTQARAATNALLRVFQGQSMDLTLIVSRVGGARAADLAASGIVKKVISGSYGLVSRNYTGRLRQLEAAHSSGKVVFEHWSFWSLIQRLMAAAQGQPYALTYSLAGSSLAKDNDDYREVADPFDPQRSVGVVRALHPDISILHADAADEEGNTVLIPPFEEGAWGAKASKGGAIVTTERIVDREFIRRHAHLVQLPARYVKAVCHVHFGARPGAFGHDDVPGFSGYGEDHAFNDAYVEATRDPARLAEWVGQWITGLRGHEDYLERLGTRRLEGLTKPSASSGDKGNEVAGQPALQTASVPADQPAKQASDNEVLMTLAMREVVKLAVESGCDVFLVGAGLSEVPATAAHSVLQEQGVEVSLAMGHGYFGFEPEPGRSDTEPGTACMSTDPAEIYGVVMAGRLGRTMAILGAAQVDRFANLNSTLIDGKLLIGSGGSNDASSMCQTLVVTRTGRRKLVERVEYETCTGKNVRAVITEKGVFEKSGGSGTLTLVSYVDSAGLGREQVLKDIAANCGWALEVSPNVQRAAMPTEKELDLVRRLMPDRYA